MPRRLGTDRDTSISKFEERLASLGIPLESLTPETGLELMCRFFEDNPSDGFLECRWGVVTHHGEKEFGLEFERFFVCQDDPFSVPTSLSLCFKIGPESAAGVFSWPVQWCETPQQLPAFRSAIECVPAFQTWGRSPASGVSLTAGPGFAAWEPGLYDRWGVRNPARPILHMTEEQWLQSDDVSLMLRWFHQQRRGEEADFDRILRRYGLACCRRIWRRLPLEEIRSAVELAERKLDGRADPEAYGRALWLAEVAHERFDPDPEVAARWTDQDSETLARWFDDVSRIPPRELAEMLNPSRPETNLSPRDILGYAAHFAYQAMCYPVDSFAKSELFHSAPLLREIFGNPFRTAEETPRRAGEGAL